MVFHERLRVMVPDLGCLVVLEADGPTSCGNTTKSVSLSGGCVKQGCIQPCHGSWDSTREDKVLEWVPTALVGTVEKTVSAPGHRICT